MPKNQDLYITKNFRNVGVTFTSADSTNIKDICISGVDDSIIKNIYITNSSTLTTDIIYYLNNGTTDFRIGHIDITASAGFNGTTNQVNGLNRTNLPSLKIDSNGNSFLTIGSGWRLRGNLRTAITSGDITVVLEVEDF